ncbi:hypothetical protein [Ktedonobacter racemifer]|uniref:Uncharacterized protein n=1 Tax=Ktedonobacter racemifer DSM 44963 TaxID=485913 RepID=D6U5G2_KTERA|nr:hypothetical protein [Ktedonobacter racemifer]EFH81742.1 hypothetical protein Krac_2488 [Ktedonobacter racemifer DSM 44963]
MSHLFIRALLSLMTGRPYVILTRWGGIVLLVIVGMLLTAHTPAPPYSSSPTVQDTSLSATSPTQTGGGEYTGLLLSPSSQQQALACGIGDVACSTSGLREEICSRL